MGDIRLFELQMSEKFFRDFAIKILGHLELDNTTTDTTSRHRRRRYYLLGLPARTRPRDDVFLQGDCNAET